MKGFYPITSTALRKATFGLSTRREKEGERQTQSEARGKIREKTAGRGRKGV